MKLNKANTTGSISVILPKSLCDSLGWKIGDEVTWQVTKDPNLLALRREAEYIDIDLEE